MCALTTKVSESKSYYLIGRFRPTVLLSGSKNKTFFHSFHNEYRSDLPFVLVVDKGGHRRDFDRVRVVGGVLEQSVVGVEELATEQEEELPRGSAVVKALLVVELHVQLTLLQVFLAGAHDLVERVFQQVFAADV